jgi:hypothetical protein
VTFAVVIGSAVAAFVGAATVNRTSPSTTNASSAEPLLSYEPDRLFREPDDLLISICVPIEPRPVVSF